MNVYKSAPEITLEHFILRRCSESDALNLLKVYSDKRALPFFNSDNCHGDNFYYTTLERMKSALDFWQTSYREGWFLRLSILERITLNAIGSVEVFLRSAEDAFDQTVLLRVDLGFDDENENTLYELFSGITLAAMDWFGCSRVSTKAPIYAIDRRNALEKAGYTESEKPLVGHDGTLYYHYWTFNKAV